MRCYYNEHDPKIAAWLRELITRGLIMDGDVDERDIRDVQADDVAGYARCHFFAGIGGWDYALQLAGWPDDRAVWTGSPPCQPFSAAGSRKGAADDRHLWPEYFRLIAQHRPPTVFGEQVAAAIGNGWLDAVFADLEEEGYSCAAAVLPACSVGAPHIRNRLWFVGHADIARPQGCRLDVGEHADQRFAWTAGESIGVADSRLVGIRRDGGTAYEPQASGVASSRADGGADVHVAGGGCDAGVMADSRSEERCSGQDVHLRPRRQVEASSVDPWACEWIECTDGKSRPVEPGTFPLAHGIPARVGRLRGYGNAIVPQVAAQVIRAFFYGQT